MILKPETFSFPFLFLFQGFNNLEIHYQIMSEMKKIWKMNIKKILTNQLKGKILENCIFNAYPLYIFTQPLCHPQNITQVQLFFLNGVHLDWIKSFPSPTLVALSRLKTQSALLFIQNWGENRWINAFPKGINMKWNADSLIQDLELRELVWFLFLMAYQSSWIIWCQSHPCGRIVVVLYNL